MPRHLLIAALCFLSLPAPAATRVACVGTSITSPAGIETDRCYPARLQALLGTGYLTQNFGSDGATLLRKGDRPYIRQEEFARALAFLPDVVFIELGTSDSNPQNRARLADFEGDYGALIDSFRTLPTKPRIITLLPPPLFTEDSAGISDRVVRDEIIPMIRQVAFAKGCEVVNLYNFFLGMSDCFPDRVHPSLRGAELIASRLHELLTMEEEPLNLIASARLEGTHSSYHGFDCLSFTFRGREAKIAFPKRVARGRPWIWRARFWGHEPQTEIALLERGFHVAYCDVSELFGNDEAVSIWQEFYLMLTGAGLSPKAALEGFSRGGIYVYRWAATYPSSVACVYADAPVLDLKSWPGGKGKSHGNPELWVEFRKDFRLATEADALAFSGNPLDLAPRIAKGGYPMLHICGDADETVPIEENTDLFEKAIRAGGGEITVVRKPGVGHHPHSLANPSLIVDFILRATRRANHE